MSIAKTWFLAYGAGVGFDVKTLTNAIDLGFVSFAKKFCTAEEEVYIDGCVESIENQLQEIRSIGAMKI